MHGLFTVSCCKLIPLLNVVFVSAERPGIQYLDDTFFEEHLVGATIVGEDTGCISR